MIPITNSTRRVHSGSYVPEYVRRIFHYPQMDLEYTFWMMFYLCINPKVVYRTTTWHKQTKNQWARDDPAFVAILMFFLAVASVAYAFAFHVTAFVGIMRLMFWSVFVDFISVGVIVATIGWWLSNRYLRVQGIHSVEQKVEWLYSFDVHCNSFFPLFLLLYVVQFFFSMFLVLPGFLSTLTANTLYFVAFAYYYHITFLGYNALPFLHNTVFFLYPIGLILIMYIASLVINFNACIFVLNIYFNSPL